MFYKWWYSGPERGRRLLRPHSNPWVFTCDSEHTLEAAMSLGSQPVAWLCYGCCIQTWTQSEDQEPRSLSYPWSQSSVPISSWSPQDISKRLSLPMDIRLPQEFLQKLQLESPDLPKPLSRMSRRASLVSPKRVRGHEGGPPSFQHHLSASFIAWALVGTWGGGASANPLPGPAVDCSGFQKDSWASGATCWPLNSNRCPR